MLGLHLVNYKFSYVFPSFQVRRKLCKFWGAYSPWSGGGVWGSLWSPVCRDVHHCIFAGVLAHGSPLRPLHINLVFHPQICPPWGPLVEN